MLGDLGLPSLPEVHRVRSMRVPAHRLGEFLLSELLQERSCLEQKKLEVGDGIGEAREITSARPK